MKTSMREMHRRKVERKAGKPENTRNPKIISPYAQRAKARAWRDDNQVEPALVVRAEDLAKLERMHEHPPAMVPGDRDAWARRHGQRPLKPPPIVIPERTDAARVAARKDRNGVA